MGFGVDALPMASHSVLLVVLALLAVRIMRAFQAHEVVERAERLGLSAAMAVACLALGIERLYALAGRALRGRGVDLYSLHPAPEVLSLIVAVGLYGVSVPLVWAAQADARGAGRRVAAEAALLLCLWGALALALR